MFGMKKLGYSIYDLFSVREPTQVHWAIDDDVKGGGLFLIMSVILSSPPRMPPS